MQSFLDVTLPPLLLLAGVIAVIVAAASFTVGKLRLYAAQRQRIAASRASLMSARTALTVIISDPDDSENVKNQAVSAYEVLTAITQENGKSIH